MSEPTWLLRRTVDTFHDEQLAEHGGREGLRDEGLLLSALQAPQNRYAYEDVSIFDMAATYAHRLSRNHPFIDGNKRTGFLAAFTFLGLNGYDLAVGEKEAAERMIALASGTIDENTFATWLREHSNAF